MYCHSETANVDQTPLTMLLRSNFQWQFVFGDRSMEFDVEILLPFQAVFLSQSDRSKTLQHLYQLDGHCPLSRSCFILYKQLIDALSLRNFFGFV